jgi:hypothetical protein
MIVTDLDGPGVALLVAVEAALVDITKLDLGQILHVSLSLPISIS